MTEERPIAVFSYQVRANETVGRGRRANVPMWKQMDRAARHLVKHEAVRLIPDKGMIHGVRALDIARVFENKGCRINVDGGFRPDVVIKVDVRFHSFEGTIEIFPLANGEVLDWKFREERTGGNEYL